MALSYWQKQKIYGAFLWFVIGVLAATTGYVLCGPGFLAIKSVKPLFGPTVEEPTDTGLEAFIAEMELKREADLERLSQLEAKFEELKEQGVGEPVDVAAAERIFEEYERPKMPRLGPSGIPMDQ